VTACPPRRSSGWCGAPRGSASGGHHERGRDRRVTIRALRDDQGIEWQVWAVHPSTSDLRHLRDDVGELTLPLAPHLAGGWLTFESAAGERRRIVPIPDGWDALDDAALTRLLREAVRQPPSHRRRRLIE
jgi:hypothetical protein